MQQSRPEHRPAIKILGLQKLAPGLAKNMAAWLPHMAGPARLAGNTIVTPEMVLRMDRKGVSLHSISEKLDTQS